MTPSGPLDIYEKFYEPGVPSHRQPNVAAASEALADLIVNASVSYDSSSEIVFQSVKDITNFGYKRPSALDYAIRVFAGANDLLPDTVRNHYGKGPTAGEGQLVFWQIEQSRFFQGGAGPWDVGTETAWDPDADEASNVNFQGQELREKMDMVLEKMRNFQALRREIIVHMALQGRCHSLDVARHRRHDFDGERAVHLIDLSLDSYHEPSPPWCKIDFIGNCIMLRGGAKSLLESMPSERREEKLRSWREGYTAFLRYDTEEGQKRRNKDNDFVLKAHAAMVLDNLTSGPRDETSDELFDVTKWMF
ncbi:hypothetical protein H2201_003265 [Coniosporium apollinis]|uniref:Uncharacterized protein n=1 Tax=Coniosporium apollinis TaxID=61459 RepID=A0ABQ9NZX0_9PEZI|nr:hypothetical protein H2201_003265 [Coniosporium apollinis]